MDIMLRDARHNYAIAYMDDIVVFSRSFEDHLVHLRTILERMGNAGLTVHPGKMQMATSKIKLLGFVIDERVLHPNEDKLKAITEFPPPHDAKSLQRFLGMVGFYRQFISHCAEITRPPNELLRKAVKWRWTEAQQNVFLQLSRPIAETASLMLPDLNRPFVLQTDASGYGLDAVLLQDFDGVLRPLAFASHTLTAAQRNYNVCELECPAIIFALQKFNMYLDGARFAIQSDNAALSWLQRLENPAGRLARWALTLLLLYFKRLYLQTN